MKPREKFARKLLVEGNDDKHVIWALCEKFAIPENFDVIDCEGIDNLIEQIPERIKRSGTISIGIIIDADEKIEIRWESVSTILSKLGFTIPSKLSKEGLVVENDGIIIGVWVMPNNNSNGMLEDFVSFLIPPGDHLAEFAKNTLQSIEQQSLNKYQVIHRSKALIHSWLAWQDDPGTPMGLAITKKYLTTDDATCQQLITWLNATFS